MIILLCYIYGLIVMKKFWLVEELSYECNVMELLLLIFVVRGLCLCFENNLMLVCIVLVIVICLFLFNLNFLFVFGFL